MRIQQAGMAALGTAFLILMGASPSLAKGHDNGFGAGAAGPATAGKVDDGQSNRADSLNGGGGSATSYGQRDATVDAKDGVSGKSVEAQDKSASHPSMR